VNSAEHEFRRERVSTRFTTEDLAVLDLGPEVGTPVVVDGVAELFGTEFVAREIEQSVLGEVDFKQEYHPEFLGEYAEAQASRQRLVGLTGFSLIGILLLLHSDFQSIRSVLLIFLPLPFALIGGVAGAFLCGRVISLGSLIGFVTVLGVAAPNGIMLIDHYRHLQREEVVPFGFELVMRGAEARLAPILMTALTTGLALVPLVMTGNKPGQEIQYPMAFVIRGGLGTSTLLNLLMLPALYAKFGRRSEAQDGPAQPSCEITLGQT